MTDEELAELLEREKNARAQGWAGTNEYICVMCFADGKTEADSTYLDWPARAFPNGLAFCGPHARDEGEA